MKLVLRSVGLLLALVVAAHVQAFEDPDPLFSSNDVLRLHIAAPLSTLMRKRSDENELPATVAWQDEAGDTVEVAVQISARGNYRRQRSVCPIAPLRLNFKRSEVKDTLFDKQDKLKLVTHCKNNSSRYEQGLLREYLAYRILNQLTDMSFRVRLLRVTYENTESSSAAHEEYGFLIESKERLGKRTGRPPVDMPNVSLAVLDPSFTNLASLFQYLIGNTDFSPIAGVKGESCCHNSTLFAGTAPTLYSVPYDFDMSGLVDARYAEPNPAFRLSSVRERLYRGRCRFNDQLPATVDGFLRQKTAILALVAGQPGFDDRSRRDASDYVEDFYATIEDPASMQQNIVAKCIR